jgi:tRNA C32,U32 (ribose-2'-O)-methylase TrmJ
LKWDYPFADTAAMKGFYEHLERVLVDIDFLNPDVPRQLMPRLQRLFNRARPDVMELNILRGILNAVEKTIRLRMETK